MGSEMCIRDSAKPLKNLYFSNHFIDFGVEIANLMPNIKPKG